MARPTDYRPKYCQMVIDHMEQGLSKESFCGIIGIDKKTLYNWMDKHPEFFHAVHIGEEKSRLFWEKAGIRGMDLGKDFNAIVWKFNIANRHGWKERADMTTDEKPIVAGWTYIAPNQDDNETTDQSDN